ncbi:hypothetical protein [Croceicoccus sp. BE223]|uniref:hypothetical protein n=1 Tax=Croceicoccus sp. BE223 TaxID=2817716 RepID=UPI00285EB4C2|nr:hypothetical protein [Croceicoccus sp. BE223]MDR7101729.1 hypothetical protein [Croceicoccus sp. BE223]
MRRRRPGFAAQFAAAFSLACLLAAPLPAGAQALRSTPDANERALQDARTRLGRNAGDLSALRDAVQAAMRLGMIDIAAAYALRAQQLAPRDAMIMAARGGIEIHRGRAREGLALFEQADKAGVAESAFAADRALGYDLIGDQPSAQYYYAMAHRQSPDDEVLRRYALSLAISGDAATGAAMLRPLLNVQDRGAWRTHAFMLAIDRKPQEARKVLQQTLPADLAAQLGPYMDAMPLLSRAQQAAAANLGIFPDLSALAAQAASTPAPPASRDDRNRR